MSLDRNSTLHPDSSKKCSLMIREHFLELSGWSVLFLSSDISQAMLDRARTGIYNQAEVNRGLPATLLLKYFDQQGADWQLKAEVRRMVDFRQINLATAW